MPAIEPMIGAGRTILIAIPLGEAVRNVLRTETYLSFCDAPGIRVVVASQGALDSSFRAEFGAPNVVFEPLQAYRPSRRERLLESMRMATLYDHSSTIRTLARPESGARFRHFVRLARLCEKLFGSERIRNALNWAHKVFVPAAHYEELIDRHRPDVVVVSRVVNYSADYPVVRAAGLRGVPVIALSASWDNFTSKGFFPVGIDRVVVWNKTMRKEAIELFGYPENRVFVSGVPRFDSFFRREGLRQRREFFAEFGLDPSRRLITYTTGTAMLGRPFRNSSPEPAIIAFLADEIATGRLGPAQLLVRLHPQADRIAFEPLADRPTVTLHVPGKSSAFPDRDLSSHENQVLGETMWHSDVVVNVASTTTIDAAIFDTPIVCVGFEPDTSAPPEHTVRRFYDFEHYAKLALCGGFRRADSGSDFISEIAQYLADPTRDADGRKRMVAQQCTYFDGRCGKRVASYILDYLEDGAVSESF